MNKTEQLQLNTKPVLDGKQIRRQFPIFSQTIHGKPLIYLDTAATAQKPQQVIDAVSQVYTNDYANVHRGVYTLSERATKHFERARDCVRKFIHAADRAEIIFTRGTTDSINLVAASFGALAIQPGDEIILTMMEHHSNIVPWQLLCARVGATLKIIPLTAQDTLDLAAYQTLFSAKTKLVAFTHVSNVLGTINPAQEMIAIAHAHHVPVLVDGAQAVSRLSVNVQELDCDFYVFSSHKLYGPTGVGVLYGKRKFLEAMPPYQGGGDMIRKVSFENTQYHELPYKFEAGTPNIAGVIGFAAALQFIESLGIERIFAHEVALTQYALAQLKKVPGVTVYGNAPEKVGVVSFTLEGIHPHDIATIVDHAGVAIRAGHHCAMPLIHHLGVTALVRVSFGVYNTTEDVDRFVDALYKTIQLFGAS